MTNFNNVSEADVTAASNSSIETISILGTALISTADDALRAYASVLAKWWDDIGGVNTVAGTGDAITVTTPTVYTALKTGMRLQFISSAINTTAVTLNLDAIGARALRKISGGVDVALVAGDIPGAKVRFDIVYDATANAAAGGWVLLPNAVSVYLPLAGTADVVALAPSANQDNYATGIVVQASRPSVVVISPTASVVISGVSTTGLETGKLVTLRNGTSRTTATGRLIILARNNASSSAANRFQFPKSDYDFAPLMLMPGEEANFRFDGTDLKFAGMGRLNIWDQFLSRNGTFLTSAVNGTGATVSQDNVETDSNGFIVPYIEPVTGTTNTGCCAVAEATERMVFGAGCILEISRVNVPTLSTAGEEFDAWCGFNDASNLGVITDAIGWYYDRNLSVNWQTYTMSNTTRTINATATAVTAGRYDSLGLFVNGDASRVDYFYSTDGGETWVIFGTAITTNIPSGAARATKIGPGILKSAGTTSRAFREMSSWMRWLR